MYGLYEKEKDNVKLVEDSENILKKGPCLLSMFAKVESMQDIKAELFLGKTALKLNSKTGLKEFKGRILAVADKKIKENNDENSIKNFEQINYGMEEKFDEEFVKKYFFPLIEENGKRRDLLTVMRYMRNVNIMSYCNSSYFVLALEKILKARMQELNYSCEEIKNILSQICMVCYATNVKFVEPLLISCLSFSDINDKEVIQHRKIKELMKNSNISAVACDEGYFFHKGEGNHNPQSYIMFDNIISTAISSALRISFANSIDNGLKTNAFTPINTQEIMNFVKRKIEEIMEHDSLLWHETIDGILLESECYR